MLCEVQRLQCGPVADYHTHPDYSIDGSGTLDEWCQAAFNIGLSEICFTPHYEANPAQLGAFFKIKGQKVPLSDESIRHYLDHIAAVSEEYGPLGLIIKAGLEFGYFPGCEKEIAGVRSKFKIDYSLGALHSFEDLCFSERDDAPRLFARYNLTHFADMYFEMLNKMAASGLVDALAHIDVYRRYGLEYYGKAVNIIHRGRIEKLFKTMRKHDVGYELNTSAIRHGYDSYYPAMEIVNMARAAGVQLVALGSDAHHPRDLGFDFDVAAATAYELFPYVDE